MSTRDRHSTNALASAFLPAGERMRIGPHSENTSFEKVTAQIAAGYAFASKTISSIAAEAAAIADDQKPPSAPALIELLSKLAIDLHEVAESLAKPSRKLAATLQSLGSTLDDMVGALHSQLDRNVSFALPELLAAADECLIASAIGAGNLGKDPLAQLSLLDRLDRVGQRFTAFGEAMLRAPRFASSAAG